MADLSSLLLGSLNPATRKQSEQSINAISTQPGFLPHLLNLILQASLDRPVRLAGSIYLKNIAKSRWEEVCPGVHSSKSTNAICEQDVQPLPEQDKVTLRSQLVPAMIALSNPADKAIRVQVAESVSLIAELDFPSKWPDLITVRLCFSKSATAAHSMSQQLVASLSSTDYNINIGVLQTAHSIFLPWRSLMRTDALFSEINLVFSQFLDPFVQLFRQTASLLLSPASDLTSVASYPIVAEAMVFLTDIYYDFTCHDIPPALEDSHSEFFGPDGWFPKLIIWDPDSLKVDVGFLYIIATIF
jgi:exportin-2 (importin alpha re-exporter)